MLIVEDGTVVSGAESYVSVADADTYFSNGGNDTWAAATTAAKESALRYATQQIDGMYRWHSTILSTSQELGWPRAAFYDEEGRSIGGSGNMPKALKNATCELAVAHLSNALNEVGDNVVRERIGSSEVQYGGSGSTKRDYRYVALLVRNLGVSIRSSGRIIRG